MFKVKNEKDLLTLLKIISEEAVKKSKKHLKENPDPLISSMKHAMDDDPLMKEEDEDEDEEEDEDTGEPNKTPSNDEDKNTDDKMPAREKAASFGSDLFDASFDSVMTAINTLRAGHSLKDKTTRTELNNYYDRLDEDERAVLLLFMREISKILTGAVEGEDAQDPSDPKAYFNITKRATGDESAPKAEEPATPKVQKPVKRQQTGEEDTTPPIKVNESQDVSVIREKVRMLMRS